MASLRKLKNYYYARVKIPRPGLPPKDKLIALNTSYRRQASIRLTEVNRKEPDIKDGSEFTFSWRNGLGRPIVNRYFLKQAIKDYLKARKGDGLRSGTLDIYENALTNFRSITGEIPVDEIKLTHIDLFKTRFIDSLAIATLNIDLRAIKTFLIWLKDNDRIKSVPKIKMLHTGKTLPIYVSNTEFKAIQSKVNSHYQRVFYFYRETGLRLSEPINGVLNGDFLTIEANTAKGHQTQDVDLRQDLKEILLELKATVSQKVNQGISSQRNAIKRYSRVFQTACKEAGITGRKFHSLRHTFAVRCYLQTKDIYEVAKRLGHASVTTTEIYANFNLKRLAQDFPDLVISKNPLEMPEMHNRDTDMGDTVYVGIA